MSKWYTLGHAVQGRGHELENPPIPCQDKIYPQKPTTYSSVGEVAFIGLADGAGSARFSHLGATRTLEVVAKELSQNFSQYTNMPNQAQMSATLLEHILQALQDLSIATTNALQRDKSDIEDIFNALLEEAQGLLKWQEAHRLPLMQGMQSVQESFSQDQEKRQESVQHTIKTALEGMAEKIKNLQGGFSGEAYQLQFIPLKDRLETLKAEIRGADFTLFSAANIKELFKETAPIEKRYYKIKDKITEHIDQVKNKRKSLIKKCYQGFLDFIGMEAEESYGVESQLYSLKNAYVFKPNLTPLNLPPKDLKSYSTERIKSALKTHKDTLKQQIMRCYEAYKAFLDKVDGVDLKEWDEDSLEELRSILTTDGGKEHKKHIQDIQAHIQKATTTAQNYQKDLLEQLGTKEQEYTHLKRRFESLKGDVLSLEGDLKHTLDRLQRKIETLSPPYTLSGVQNLLLSKATLQKDFTLYETYAKDSTQLKHDLQSLSLSLPPEATRPFSHVRASLEKSKDQLNTPTPTKEFLSAPRAKGFLEHANTLESQAKEWQTLHTRQKQLESFSEETKALEKTLKEHLGALGVCCAHLHEGVKKLQVQSLWQTKDLDPLNNLPLDTCKTKLEHTLHKEKALTQQFNQEWHQSIAPTTPPKITLKENLQKLQDSIQNKACSLQDLASTLLAVALQGDDFLLLHLGDGVCGVLKGRELKVASHPDNGEFGNETTFTTSKDAPFSMKIFKGKLSEKNFTGFALMSDGASESFYHNKDRILVPLLQDYMNVARVPGMQEGVQKALETLLEGRVKEKTFDDCSVIALVLESHDPLSETEKKLQAKITKSP
ncbi:protein phosphatase 2C domain-containing protein [Helicobacter ailurogastricus]|uniref:PPM-type phosphatase domain-containing protein n=1 Tax=Helicobacter ailurogastricus TaxID=1578720 RepID=A0A0K2X8E7_9HELI|nr:protein phosphatase 2C domain-containing protein [Helicobacter ailurogastricus]CRF40765.1 hypothetical protein HAL011_05280 [Helicobacter ailurogastricus]CRF42471.1 hypothetical protein HAL013_06520 [Helicobacter ailurogastricus]CRF43665.1 hypothetical protein HAL09_02120 [Helicobacter ailurogastricus]